MLRRFNIFSGPKTSGLIGIDISDGRSIEFLACRIVSSSGGQSIVSSVYCFGSRYWNYV